MTTSFQIQDYKDGKLITVSSPLQGRPKILHFSYAMFFFISSVLFAYLLLKDRSINLVASILSILGTIACAIGFYRLMKRATESEKIFVNKKTLEIIKSGFSNRDVECFAIDKISDFKFSEKKKFAPHPLKGETFDYLGFQTEQEVIQDLHMEGRVSFVYDNRIIKFGRDLTSWEFNELEVLLYDLTGNDFRYTDKYEQENFPKR
jgi:hypothetical protein